MDAPVRYLEAASDICGHGGLPRPGLCPRPLTRYVGVIQNLEDGSGNMGLLFVVEVRQVRRIAVVAIVCDCWYNTEKGRRHVHRTKHSNACE